MKKLLLSLIIVVVATLNLTGGQNVSFDAEEFQQDSSGIEKVDVTEVPPSSLHGARTITNVPPSTLHGARTITDDSMTPPTGAEKEQYW